MWKKVKNRKVKNTELLTKEQSKQQIKEQKIEKGKKRFALLFTFLVAIGIVSALKDDDFSEKAASCGESCSITCDRAGEATGAFFESCVFVDSCAEGCTPEEDEASKEITSEETEKVSLTQSQFDEMLSIYNVEYGQLGEAHAQTPKDAAIVLRIFEIMNPTADVDNNDEFGGYTYEELSTYPLEDEDITNGIEKFLSNEIAIKTAKVYNCGNEEVDFGSNLIPGDIFIGEMPTDEIESKAIEAIKAEYEATNGNVGLINSDDVTPEDISRIYNAYVASQLLCGYFGLENNMSYLIEVNEKTTFDVNAEVVNALAIKLSEAVKLLDNSQSLGNGTTYKLR